MDARARDNMYYDEYAWDPPDDKNQTTALPDQTQTDPWKTECGNNCLSDQVDQFGQFLSDSTSGLTNQAAAATGQYPTTSSSTPEAFTSSSTSQEDDDCASSPFLCQSLNDWKKMNA